MWKRTASLIRSFLTRRRFERELDDELQAAVDELAARHVARGLDPAAARRAARLELGGVEQVKEQVRDVRAGNGIETAARDIRYAWRSLWRTPGFAGLVILTLGLGIGATTAIFTVVNALLLEPLPYRGADRLVFVWQDLTDAGYPRAPLAAPELLDLRHRATLFDGFGGIWANTSALTGDGGLFETVGATLSEGRYFTEADVNTSAAVAIVDDRLARAVWPGDSAIGKRMQADPFTTGTASQWVTVVGVVKHLRHRNPAADLGEQIYFPAAQSPRNPMAYVVRSNRNAAALAGPIREVLAQIDPQLPMYDVRPMLAYADAARATRRFTMILAAAFALVALVLACVGVYGVTAYSVALRRHEFGVRQALGAGAGQIVRLVLNEGVTLAGAGVGLGLVGAVGAAFLLRAQLFDVAPTDAVSYGVAVPLLAVAALAACWIPARRATKANPLESLRAD